MFYKMIRGEESMCVYTYRKMNLINNGQTHNL